MAGADLTTLTGIEKDVYEKSISEGVNNNFDLKDYFKLSETDYLGGEGVVWAHHHGRNASPFWANEGGAYPVAGNQVHSKGRIGIKKLMGRIQLTEEAMEDLRRILDGRNGLYSKADATVKTTGKKAEQSYKELRSLVKASGAS